MTITLDRSFFLDNQKMDVFCAALIRTKDIEEAAKVAEGKDREPTIITLDAKESSDVYHVLQKAVFALGRIARENPNEGNLAALEHAKRVKDAFGNKNPIGGYASNKARDEHFANLCADDCAKHGCD